MFQWNHTLPYLPRRTRNDLQQTHHENSWLLCVRAQDSSGLALVPCTSCAVDKRGRIETHSLRPTCMKRCFFVGQKGSGFALTRLITAKQGGDPAPIFLGATRTHCIVSRTTKNPISSEVHRVTVFRTLLLFVGYLVGHGLPCAICGYDTYVYCLSPLDAVAHLRSQL